MANSNIIVCFGDSNTEGGYGGGTAHTAILSNMMKGYEVVNAGKAGELTADGVNRIGSVLETHKPKYVLLLEGTNDVNGGVTAATVASNLGAMADIARRYGAIPIVATLPPNTWFAGGAAVPAYNEAIADMAAKRNIKLVDAYSLLIDDWNTLNTDGLHYNARGAEIVAAGFAEALGSVGEFIIGTKGDDMLMGGANNDTLKGLTGSDVIYGGAGNDVLKGGKKHDQLFGDEGEDMLLGGKGRDTLCGGAGQDTLTGGKGRDVFVFDGPLAQNEAEEAVQSDADVIVDFTVGKDSIQLSREVFTQLAAGRLGDDVFCANGDGAAMKDTDYILYNTQTGALLYDPDGSGDAAAVQFAELSNKPGTLSAADFIVA